MVFSIGLRSFEGCVSILGVLRHSSFLGLVVVLSCPEDSLIVFSEVCYFGIDLFLFTPVLSFSSSHNIVVDRMIIKFKIFIPLIINTLYYTKQECKLETLSNCIFVIDNLFIHIKYSITKYFHFPAHHTSP